MNNLVNINFLQEAIINLNTRKFGDVCEIFEIENSIGIKNPFSRSDRPNRFCHMKN